MSTPANKKMFQQLQINIKGRNRSQIIQQSFFAVMKKTGSKQEKQVYWINSDVAEKATKAIFFDKLKPSNTHVKRLLGDAKDCGYCDASLLLSSHCVLCECGHMFHYACIRSWWDQDASCAVCLDKAGSWIPIDRRMSMHASQLSQAERGKLLWNRNFFV